MYSLEDFIRMHHLQTLGGKDRFGKEFSQYEWSAPVIQTPDHLREYIRMIGLVGAEISDVHIIEYPCLFDQVLHDEWRFEFDNAVAFLTNRGTFEIEYTESSSIRISKNCIPERFYYQEDSVILKECNQLFAYLKGEKVTGIAAESQTFHEADWDFTGSCGIELKSDLPSYLKEFRLLFESGRQLSFTSDFDWGIMSLYDADGRLVNRKRKQTR